RTFAHIARALSGLRASGISGTSSEGVPVSVRLRSPVLAGALISFAVACGGSKTAALSVVSFLPAQGSTSVPPNTAIAVTFNREIDPASLAFTFVPPVDGVATAQGVAGAFQPAQALASQTSFSVT